MKYYSHRAALPGVSPSFMLIVDDETMTWESDPLENDVRSPILNLRFSREGDRPIGSGKYFNIFPDGRVEEAR